MSWLLWIVLQWTLGCIYLFELWFSLDICLGLGLLDHACVCTCVISCFSCVWLVAVWTVDYSPPPLSMGFTRQEYWTGRPDNLPNPGIEPSFLCLLHYGQILYCWATGETARLYGSSIFSVVAFLKDIPYCFPQWLHQFTFLPTV